MQFGPLEELLPRVTRDFSEFEQRLEGVTEAHLVEMWSGATLRELFLTSALLEPNEQTLELGAKVLDELLRTNVFKGKSAAALGRKRSVERVRQLAVEALTRAPLDHWAAHDLATEIHTASSRTTDYAARSTLDAAGHLVYAVLRADDGDLAEMAHSAKMVGYDAQIAFQETFGEERLPEIVESIRRELRQPTLSELRDLPRHLEPRRPEEKLDALVWELQHGPLALADHLEAARWGKNEIERHFRKSSRLATIFALAAVFMESKTILAHLTKVLREARPRDKDLSRVLAALKRAEKSRKFWANVTSPAARPLRDLARANRNTIRANAAYRIGLLLGESATLAKSFRESVAADMPEDLEYWLSLSTESSEEVVAREIERDRR